MLRIVCCICLAALFCGCEKNWRGLVVEKRVYRDGYYVHLPWERRAPVHQHQKPEPYPVDRSRTATSDTMRSTAGGGSGNSSGSSSGRNSSGSSGSGSNGSSLPDPAPPAGTGVSTTSLPPVAVAQPAPPLSYEPDQGTPPLQRTHTSTPDSVAPDTAVVVNDSVALPVDSAVAKKRTLDFPDGDFSLVAELGFCAPASAGGIEIKPFSYNAGISGRYSVHAWARHTISLEAGVFAAHHFIGQEQYKSKPLFGGRRDHERILQLKTRFMLLDHIYINRNPEAKVDAVEFGVFSDLGFFSSHVAIDNSSQGTEALLTRNKTRLFGLHYLRKAQFGLTARIANDVWSVFTNYRFGSLLKAASDDGDLPKLVIGATFAFGG